MKNLLLFSVFVTWTLQSNAQTVTDIDGNVYNKVTIGTQVWMAENLRTTRYNNGTAIPLLTNDTEWSNLTSPGYCWYANDEVSYKNTFGSLYNWYTVETGNLCPTGWHVPTDVGWLTLTDYLGGDSVAGGKLKETDTIHWHSPNKGATNETDFTALPGGNRATNGVFHYIGYYGTWWSSPEYSSTTAWNQTIFYDKSSLLSEYDDKKYGFSVRCISDNKASITNSVNSDEMILYPNPATQKLYIKDNNYANTLIMIFDLHGKQVLSKQINSEPIDISNLRKAIYVVKLIASENVLITKFIKE